MPIKVSSLYIVNYQRVSISFKGEVISVVTQEKHIGNVVGTYSDLLEHTIQYLYMANLIYL